MTAVYPLFLVRRVLRGGRPVQRDGEELHELQCPRCGVWGQLDRDQLEGRVSAACVTPACTFHVTAQFADFTEDEEVPR